jgi:hypothetical protein
MNDRTCRRWSDIRIFCEAPEEIIGQDIAPEILDRYTYSFPLPCEGGGEPGQWCDSCYWSGVEELGGGEGEP